jgi:hypothetical protein
MIINIGGNTAEEQTINCAMVIRSYLSESDWTQIPNNPLTLEYSAEWAVYRQQLREFMDTWIPSDQADIPNPPMP